MAQAWCHLSPAKTGAAAPFELRPKSALSPRYPPDRITNIVGDQQSSVAGDRHADRPAHGIA